MAKKSAKSAKSRPPKKKGGGGFFKWFLILVVLAVGGFFAYRYYQERTAPPTPDTANLTDLRSLNTAIATYHKAYGHYPLTLEQLAVPDKGGTSEDAAGLVGAKLSLGRLHGYHYTYIISGPAYEIHADPESSTSKVHLYTDQSTDIRVSSGKPAGPSSEIIE